MEEITASTNPALTVALALAAGIVCQSVARHLRLPGIVILLAAGVLLGPDVADIVRPNTLGAGLQTLVGFAVAVILFEGGMNLNVSRMRREGPVIPQLVTLGALVTAAGGALAARVFLEWDWRNAVLFGTLVIVTGPTVITPLLRRLKVERSVATVLEAEGVFIDAIGAIVAVIALEVALSPSGTSLANGMLTMVLRLGFGAVAGFLVGLALAWLLRRRNVVPEGLENVFTLSMVFALFQVSNTVMPESGIAAVTAAGIVVGNMRTHVQRELLEFKEQLTTMLIGLLFVLLAADVRLSRVTQLGMAGVYTVAALILVVRPLNVLVGTWGSDLSRRQKLFMAWIGPRGIVAAAVASFFALELERQGIAGGDRLRAMVFLVIACTVLLAGLTGGGVARLLGLRRPVDTGWVILGANELARLLARSLRDGGEEVLCIDTNPDACQLAQEEGLRVIFGNGLESRTLRRAEIDTRTGAIGLTPNTGVNVLFAQTAKREGKLHRLLVGVGAGRERVLDTLEDAGAELLFGHPVHSDLWSVRLRRDICAPQRWKLHEQVSASPGSPFGMEDAPESVGVAVVSQRGQRTMPFSTATQLRPGDTAMFLLNRERLADATSWLRSLGWRPVAEEIVANQGSATEDEAVTKEETPASSEDSEPSD